MKIKTYEDGSARLLWDWRDIALTAANFETLRAFFQAERDEALGRWRDPENPDMIVYRADRGDAVYVFNEREGGASQYWTRRNAESRDPAYTGYSASCYTTLRYFAAHPEPMPWEKAQPGEFWILTRYGAEEPFLVTGGEFTSTDLAVIVDLDSDSITAGHRIWPEEDK